MGGAIVLPTAPPRHPEIQAPDAARIVRPQRHPDSERLRRPRILDQHVAGREVAHRGVHADDDGPSQEDPPAAARGR
jgi:hypothetical protein